MDITKKIKTRGRQMLILTVLVMACVFLNGCGGEKQKVYRVGILSGLEYIADTGEGFKAGMTELGYIEGKNIIYDVRQADFPIGNEPIIQKFIEEGVDLIFVFPTEASMEAKKITSGTDVPVVFAIANTEGTGLADNIREPGGNITGIRYPGPDIALKRLEIMLELVPKAKRIWIPYQRGYPIISSQLEVLYPAASALGITLLECPASDAAELQTALDAIEDSGELMDAIMFVAEPLTVTPGAFTVMGKFALKHNIPIGGALMSVGEYESIFGIHVDNVAVGKQASLLADKILRGTPAGKIPVVSAESYFEINYKAAKQFGLKVSERPAEPGK